jgi:hypothetical protein
MAQASPSVSAQVAVLAMKQLEGRLDWDDFLQVLPEDIRDDELVHELIELLQLQPPPGFISDEASAKSKERVLEKIGQLTLEVS